MTHKKSKKYNTVQPITHYVGIESLNEIFQDITAFIHNYHNGECVTMTARYIVLRSIKGADSYNCGLVNPCADMVELMVELGWLKLVAVGTTFDDQLLYEL